MKSKSIQSIPAADTSVISGGAVAALNRPKVTGYVIEPRHTVDGGNTWRRGGWHTTRDTWFSDLDEAIETLDSIVRGDSRFAGVVVDESDGDEVYFADHDSVTEDDADEDGEGA